LIKQGCKASCIYILTACPIISYHSSHVECDQACDYVLKILLVERGIQRRPLFVNGICCEIVVQPDAVEPFYLCPCASDNPIFKVLFAKFFLFDFGFFYLRGVFVCDFPKWHLQDPF
jgi:hypothetical protein